MLDLLAGVPSHSFRYPHHVLCPGMARFSARYCTWRHCCTIYHCVRRRQFFRGRLCYGTVVLSVCLCVCLSVAFVCCGQTARWIKMSLCTKVGLGPGHTVLDGDPAPPRKEAQQDSPHFSAHVYCGQTVAHLSYC